jgi:hypothetical protein
MPDGSEQREDALSGARGVLNGLVVAVAFWLAVACAAWVLLGCASPRKWDTPATSGWPMMDWDTNRWEAFHGEIIVEE